MSSKSSILVLLALSGQAFARTCYNKCVWILYCCGQPRSVLQLTHPQFSYGDRYHCSGLSNGARIGIGIAVGAYQETVKRNARLQALTSIHRVAVVGLLILSLLAFTSRRRRLARNRAFIVNQQQQGETPMGQGQWNNGGQAYGGQGNMAGGPNYPPATHQTGPGGFVPPVRLALGFTWRSWSSPASFMIVWGAPERRLCTSSCLYEWEQQIRSASRPPTYLTIDDASDVYFPIPIWTFLCRTFYIPVMDPRTIRSTDSFLRLISAWVLC